MKPSENPFLRGVLTAALTLPMAITASADTALSTGNNIIDTTGDPALGVITRSTGDTAWFDANGTATAAGTPLVNGILGPWASIGTGTATRYATLDGSNNVVAYAGYSDVAYNGIPNGGAGTVNYRITSAGSVAYGSGTRNINSLTHSAGATTLTWGNAAGQINLVTNGVLNAGSGTLTLVGGGSNANSGVMIGANNNRELVVNAASAGISLGKIIDNTGGASSVTIVGSGSNAVTFTGANTFTGPIHVLSGGTLNFGSSQAVSQTVIGAGSINNTGGTATLSGDFSGFSGTYTHNTTTSSTVITNTASLSKDAAYHIASAQGSSQGIITNVTSGDNTYELGSLSGVSNSLVRNGGSVTGTSTFRIGNLNTNTEFAGIIGGGGGTIAVEKVGGGTLTLSGTSAYTGATSVSSGTLVVNGNISTSTLTTVSGGTLQGSGVTGDLAVTAGIVAPGNSIESLGAGNISISGPGTYAYELDSDVLNGDLLYGSGTLDLSSGAILTLTELASGTLTAGDKLTLISYAGTWNNGLFEYLGNTLADDSTITLGANQWLFNYNDLTGGTNFSADQAGATGFVTMTVVPEPSAALLGGLGLLGLLRRRR